MFTTTLTDGVVCFARRASIASRLLITGLIASSLVAIPAGAAHAAACASNVRSGYTVQICFSTPDQGATLAGDQTVSATVSFTGSSPGVSKLIFTIGGLYMLTDYEAPYSFSLPTDRFTDGNHTLGVSASLRDGFETSAASIGVALNNGVIEPPVNTNTFSPATGTDPDPGEPFVLAATGDGASGRTQADEVLTAIQGMDPNLLLYLGDVYEKGTFVEFHNWYGAPGVRWGQFRSITNPTIGNHEYENGIAPGYDDYWDNPPDYFSFDVAGWHFVALNSDSHFGEYTPGSGQYNWLASDLAASSAPCTIAYFHHPVLSIGPQGDTPNMNAMWRLLADSGVDIVLSGHDHNYQRWHELDRDFQPTTNGIVEFVLGGGGHGIRPFVTTDPRVEFGIDDTTNGLGALKLELNPTGATFAYLNRASTIVDQGIIPCSGAGSDTEAPSAPQLTGQAINGFTVDLSWSAAMDNVGIDHYAILRDGVEVDQVGGAVLMYQDTGLAANTTYDYVVAAVDPSGNATASNTVPIATPAAPPVQTFLPEADAYVSAAASGSNFGTDVHLRTDGSPEIRSYLRFDVPALGGAVTSATLRIKADSNHNGGFEVRGVSNVAWGEPTITFNNAPGVGTILGSSGPVAAGEYIEIDVTDYITDAGLKSFALTATNNTNLKLSSRETLTPPELVVNTGAPLNHAPTAISGSSGTVTDAPVVIVLNGSDEDGDCPLAFEIDEGPAIGSLGAITDLQCSAGVATANVTYTPGSGATGPDAFTFTVADNEPLTSDPATVSVDVSAPQSSYTFHPTDDAYVSSSSSGSNFGSSSQLRVDGSPDIKSYVRFDVPALGGPVANATLRVHADSSLAAGFEMRTVSGPDWSEQNITYNNAPAPGALIGASGPVSAGSYVEVDVSAVVSGAGLVSFVLTPLSNTNLSLSSSETLTPPELVIETDISGNSAPSANDDSIATDEDVAVGWTPLVSDVDGDQLACTITAQPQTGIASVASDCSSGSFTPDPDVSGNSSFEYEVSDGSLADVATVTVTVAPVNDAPTVTPVSVATSQGAVVTIQVVSSDVDGDCPVTFAVETGPSAGSLGPFANVQCDGGTATADIDYTPDTGTVGQDSFTYTASDALLTSNAELVVVDVAPAATSATYTAVADAYVDGSAPTTNFGSANQLRVDGSPDIRSYVRFVVTSTASPTGAVLRIHAGSTLAAGFEVRVVADNAWGESSITYSNAPGMGALVGTSGPVTTGTNVEIDVSAAVAAPGAYSFVLTPLSNTNLRLSSRETSDAPTLTVDF